jgi:hypothetical protein
MPLKFVLDEHHRGVLWDAIYRHNLRGIDPLDVVRVGDPTDLPLGIKDPPILLWAEREGRILVSSDKSTMATHLADHLAAGHRGPGVMTIRPGVSLREVLNFLVLAAYGSDPAEWQDRIAFVP